MKQRALRGCVPLLTCTDQGVGSACEVRLVEYARESITEVLLDAVVVV